MGVLGSSFWGDKKKILMKEPHIDYDMRFTCTSFFFLCPFLFWLRPIRPLGFRRKKKREPYKAIWSQWQHFFFYLNLYIHKPTLIFDLGSLSSSYFSYLVELIAITEAVLFVLEQLIVSDLQPSDPNSPPLMKWVRTFKITQLRDVGPPVSLSTVKKDQPHVS